MRKLSGPLKTIVAVWAALVELFIMYTAIFGIFQPRIQRGVVLFFLLPLIALHKVLYYILTSLSLSLVYNISLYKGFI